MNMKKLDRLLSEGEHTKQNGCGSAAMPQGLVEIRITNGALEKAKTYASLIKEVHKHDQECYGFLLGKKNADPVQAALVQDVVLAHDQDVTSASVRLDGAAVIRTAKEILSKGYRVLGWWHSHSNFGTFHSGTDDNNLFTVLNQIAPINSVKIHREKNVFNGALKGRMKDGALTLGAEGDSKVLQLTSGSFAGAVANALSSIDIASLMIKWETKIGFAYSVVVNANGAAPYTEIATREWCPLCCVSHEEKQQVGLVQVAVENDVAIDKDAMAAEVKERVKVPVYAPVHFHERGRIGFWPSFGELIGISRGSDEDFDEQYECDSNTGIYVKRGKKSRRRWLRQNGLSEKELRENDRDQRQRTNTAFPKRDDAAKGNGEKDKGGEKDGRDKGCDESLL